jgi:hypothetical protein
MIALFILSLSDRNPPKLPCEEPFFSDFIAASNTSLTTLSVKNWTCVFASDSHRLHLSASCATTEYVCTISVLFDAHGTTECVGRCDKSPITIALQVACIALGSIAAIFFSALVFMCCRAYAPCCKSLQRDSVNPQNSRTSQIVPPVIQYQVAMRDYAPTFLAPYPPPEYPPTHCVSAGPTVELTERDDTDPERGLL